MRSFGLASLVGLSLWPADLLAAPPAATRVARLEVKPARLILPGVGERFSLRATAVHADGSRRDVTDAARFRATGAVRLLTGALGESRSAGDGTVLAEYSGTTGRLPVKVLRAVERPVSFRYDVLPILTRLGCNQGACHGNSEGRGGFKLSLRAELPELDHSALAIHGGRRVNRADPARSLLLLKATSAVPHAGGRRFRPESREYHVLARWVGQGAPLDPEHAPSLRSLEVTPAERIHYPPARFARLSVLASFSDGSVRDVSEMALYNCEEPAMAVAEDGAVTCDREADAAVQVRYAGLASVSRLTFVARSQPVPALPPAGNFVDDLQSSRLQALRLTPSSPATDQEFLRRVYLDLIGTLPTPAEVEQFLADDRPDRRARLIDALLARPEFNEFWAMKWADLLRVEERSLDPKGAAAYREWIRTQLAANRPLDEFARDLITATGSTYGNPPANYLRRSRKPEELAETTMQVFLGVRLLCAQCHDHPTDRWKQGDYYSLAAFFARVTRKGELTRKDRFDLNELIGEEQIGDGDRGEVRHPRTGETVLPRLPGDGRAVPDGQNPRVFLASWLASGQNPQFARAMVNRVWAALFGRGLVEPVDDLRASNPASNPALLDRLAREFAESRCDLRALVRLLAGSRTYQLSSTPNATNLHDERYFSRALVRRLPAEVLLDALSQVTEVPEEFQQFPPGTRAIQVYPLNKRPHRFLRMFGQPPRESVCDCDRTEDSSLAQSFELISGEAIHRRLSAPRNRLRRLIAAGVGEPAILRELYLASLSRPPTAKEQADVSAYLRRAKTPDQGWEDILWAILNSREFLLRR